MIKIKSIVVAAIFSLLIAQSINAQNEERMQRLHQDMEKVVVQHKKLEAMMHEVEAVMNQAREAGDGEKANKAAVELAAIRQQLERTSAARKQMEATIEAVGRTMAQNAERRARLEQRQEQRQDRPRDRRERPDQDRRNIGQRLEHLRAALGHLREAGANDMAGMVERQIAELERQTDRPRGDRPPRERDMENRDRPRDRGREREGDRPREGERDRRGPEERENMNNHDREILGAIRELNEAVRQLRNDMNQLRRKVDGGGR